MLLKKKYINLLTQQKLVKINHAEFGEEERDTQGFFLVVRCLMLPCLHGH